MVGAHFYLYLMSVWSCVLRLRIMVWWSYFYTGTARKYANKDVVNPGSVILSGEMMLRHLGVSPEPHTLTHSLRYQLALGRLACTRLRT